MTGFESFVGIDPWTALFTFCNMMITFAVLKKFLFKPVKKMIDDRQAEIDTMYADADAAKQKAAELEQEYQQHLQSIRDERDTLLREATARAQKREEEIVGEARAEAAALRAAAEADIAQERKKAVNDLKNEIGGIAVDIAGKVVERERRGPDRTDSGGAGCCCQRNAGAWLSALVDDAQCPQKRALCVAGSGVCAGASVSCQLLKDFVRSRHSARTACLRKSLP